MKNSIILTEMTPQLLKDLICEGVKTEMEAFKKNFHKEAERDDLLSREEAANLLKIDLSSLWRWQQRGKVKAYSIAGKRYYKRSELLESLKELKK